MMDRETTTLKSAESGRSVMFFWLQIVFELPDFQYRYGRNPAVVGQKRAAVSHHRSCHLNRVGRLKLKGCAKLCCGFEERTVNVDKTEATASRQ
jgi:hypothetical protein